ncbi:MAG: hypothetical protein FLDDKLPJ_02576 [Phycisphaerae bacterium]|nr:hypothetical protein [Phycisphaerae bacterium]
MAQRKFVLTDTLEEEYYDLNEDDFELANLMHSDPPTDLGDLRTEITDSMGIAIVPNPSTADWNLPIAKPGEPYPYTINFSAIGGSGNYEWCLWDFTSDPYDCEGEACDACDKCDDEDINLDHLGCLFPGVKPNGDKCTINQQKVDCICNSENCPCTCKCGLPSWLTWNAENATLTPDGNVTGTAGTCFQFVVAAKDDSISPYDGRSQRVVRLFRISVGEGYGIEQEGFDTHVAEDAPNTTYCGETTLLVSGETSSRKVALIRFDRQELNTGKRVETGELILHATTNLTDATLYYLDDAPEECSKWFFPASCSSLTWTEWSSTIDDNIFPVATAWDIKAGSLVRFDITDYLKLKRNKCGWISHPYLEFAIASSDPTAEGGFYSTEGAQGHHAPRLAFYFTEDETDPDENTTNRCSDCSDNDCDGKVDCDDLDPEDCCDKPGCAACDP